MKKLHYFRNTKMTAFTLAIALICVVFLGNIFIRYSFAGDKQKNMNPFPVVKEGKAPIFLRWDFNLNLKNEACMPGQDIKLDITLIGGQGDIKIGEKIPGITIESVGTSDHKSIIEEISLPQLKDKAIRKGETFNFTLNIKAPDKPGTYIVEFGEVNLVNMGSMSGGGARFTVLASKSEVYLKNMDINKEINAHGNIIKVKDIIMNEKQTTVNYTITFAQRHADCSFELRTDTGETLYEISWMGKDIQNGMDASASFNPVLLTAKKLILEVSNLGETTAEGVKDIEGAWKLEIPLS